MTDSLYGVPFHSYGVDVPDIPDTDTFDDALELFWASLDIVPSETTECLPWIHPETGIIYSCYCVYAQELEGNNA